MTDGVESNLPSFSEAIDRIVDCIDFTRPGIEGSIGEDALDLQAYRILDRAQLEQGSEGQWDENKGTYKQSKDKRSLLVGVGLAASSNDRMLAALNVKGEQSIASDEATMSFGATPSAKSKGDWFTNGSEGELGKRSGAKNQPPRPFYEFTQEDIEAATDGLAEEAFKFFLGW